MVKKIFNLTCIIQARLSSKRLPKKILKRINKKNNSLDFLIARLKMSKFINKIIIAYPKNKKNSEILKQIKKYKVEHFGGSENNVLDRFYKTATNFNAKNILRITADCPFADPKLIDKLAKKFFQFKLDYYCNTNPPSFPDGFDIEIFNYKSLKYCWKNAKSKYDLEHVTPFLRRSSKIFKGNYKIKTDFSRFRVTLDNLKDLKIIKKIANNLDPEKYFSWKVVLKKLKSIKNKKI